MFFLLNFFPWATKTCNCLTNIFCLKCIIYLWSYIMLGGFTATTRLQKNDNTLPHSTCPQTNPSIISKNNVSHVPGRRIRHITNIVKSVPHQPPVRQHHCLSSVNCRSPTYVRTTTINTSSNSNSPPKNPYPPPRPKENIPTNTKIGNNTYLVVSSL